jgi:integrase
MVKLTAAAIERFKPGTTRREIPDTTSGLRLIIQPSGSRSFAVRFRRPDGRPAKLTLGPAVTDRETTDEPVLGAPLTLWQARQLASHLHRERARGTDVIAKYAADRSRARLAAVEEAASTFGAAAKEFFIHHRTKWGTRPRRWRDDARTIGLRFPPGSDPETAEPEVIKGGLVDTWGTRPISGIDAHDVIAAVDDASRNGIPGLERANEGTSGPRGRKVHAALSTLFRFLQRRRRIAANPAAGVWRPGPPPARDRILNDGEIAIFWRACAQLDAPYGQLFRLLLLSGTRRDELTRLRRDEIVEDRIVLPSERTKNHIRHDVYITPLMREQFDSLPPIERKLVFAVGRRVGVPGDFSRAKVTLDEAMAKLAAEEGRPSIPAWRIHDLRRSCASGLQALGVRHEVIEKTLNHVSGAYAGVAGTYQRAELWPERVEALERWSAHIAGLVTERGSVTPLKRRGA